MGPELEIALIAIVVSVACVIPGVFLVLRGMALMSDAISHAILLGIVVMFFIFKDLDSPWLIMGASLAGLLTVALTELIIKTKRLKQDAAIGLVFPVFFSIGVILISRFASKVHLDTDAVLLGELAFAPFHRFYWQGLDLGPISLWMMGGIMCLNLVLVTVFYKELKVATFDQALASSLGFSPVVIHYGLMSVTSITAVGAFDAVGSILVVALMITPPATAFLLTKRLSVMIGLSILFGAISAIAGGAVAIMIDGSIAGCMATMTGLLFIGVLFLEPEKGILAMMLRRKRHRLEFSAQLLGVQLLSHEGTEKESVENTFSNMTTHMEWSKAFAHRVTQFSIQKSWIDRKGNKLTLTPLGREIAKSTMVN